MPASGISKLALHLSRFANYQAVNQGANALRGSAGTGAGTSASSAASVSSAGANAGSGVGGAKFHAGSRGAHFTYTNTGGRAVVQAGSSSSTDSPNGLDEEEEHHLVQQHHALHHHRTTPSSRQRRSSTLAPRSTSTALVLHRESEQSTRVDTPSLTHSLTDNVMQARFRNAFAANGSVAATAATDSHNDAVPTRNTTDTAASIRDDSGDIRFFGSTAVPLAGDHQVVQPTAELYRDLIDAKQRKDRVAILSLVDAYRRLPPSEKTTAGFNVALQAQFSVRQPGESLREVRQTHQDMLEAGCLPNSSTSAVLIKALCVRDEEKQGDDTIPAVTVEEEASSEAWRVLQTSASGLQDISAYNALLARCAAKANVERADSIWNHIVSSATVRPNAATYVALIECYAADTANATTLSSIKSALATARNSMQSVDWVNDADHLVYAAYIKAMTSLKLPGEAVAMFEQMLVNADDLPSPSSEVTDALVLGFVSSGDLDTARSWVAKIETLNAACDHGDKVIAAPDFSSLKHQLGINVEESDRSLVEDSDRSQSHSDTDAVTRASSATPATSPDVASQAPLAPKVDRDEIQFSDPRSSFDYSSIQQIDQDLGERIKSMLRARRQGNKQQPNIEGAFHLAETALLDSGIYAPPEVYAQLLNLFGRAGKLARVHQLRDYAHAAVAQLAADPAWQTAAWTDVEDNAVAALAHGGDLPGAHAVKEAMLASGVPPSANAYAALISSIRDSTDEALLAEQLWEESRHFGVRPNIYLVNTVISRLGRARRAERALQLYESLPSLGLKPTSITYGASLNCAVRVGDVHTAEAIFEAMESDPTFVPRPPGYNSMIQCFTYTKPDRAKALEYWGKMQARGVQPSSHTYKLLLDIYGAIEPVDVNAMNATFLRLLRDHSVQVAGPHWAALISCHGQDLEKCRDIFRSIPLKTGSTPDAVAYEALLQVYANHARVDLVDALLAEMMRLGVARTAYVANHAIQGYAKTGTFEGLTKARTIFLAMSQPPAGVASTGNHPLPRSSGAGAHHAGGSEGAQQPRMPIEDVLAAEVGASPSSAADATWAVQMDLESSLNLLHAAFASVHPEPSTYEKMINIELEAGCPWNAQCVVERMSERAFPAALVVKARNLLNKAM